MSSSLAFTDPQYVVDQIIRFLKETYAQQQKKCAVIAVSGGIDSALSLTLLSQALPRENIFPVFLPYKDQSIQDSQNICELNSIPKENWYTINIASIVDAAASAVLLDDNPTATGLTKYRKGNLMARARMMLVFDLAKEKDALVCGTENKSEHYLGYFTRFGDAASDIEPICLLYKTQVRQLGKHLLFPDAFLEKAPSAGLWDGQTDEQEMGFSYKVADQVLFQLIDQQKNPTEISIENVPAATVQAVIQQMKRNAFKREVPYVPSTDLFL